MSSLYDVNNGTESIIQSSTSTPTPTPTPTYSQDGPEALSIARHIPYYPFKGLPRFYDISVFLRLPSVFSSIVAIFVSRYSALDIDVVAGVEARGFVLGPPIALGLGKPFVMIRKKGKMPNCVESEPYECEYGKRTGMCLQRDAVKDGQR